MRVDGAALRAEGCGVWLGGARLRVEELDSAPPLEQRGSNLTGVKTFT